MPGTYSSIVEMAQSQSLLNRVAACAAQEGIENPREWAWNRAWEIVSHSSDWASAWDYGKATATDANNPDVGARPDVITDTAILSTVQAMSNPAA